MIRPATEADLPAIVALERRIATAPHWAEGEYAAMLVGDPARRCLFIDDQGGMAGYAVAAVLGGEAELEAVAVGEQVRRLGIGRALCEAVMDWARLAGATEMLLEVRARSLEALRLYRSLGFVAVGRRPGYYADPPDDAVAMRCTLRAVEHALDDDALRSGGGASDTAGHV